MEEIYSELKNNFPNATEIRGKEKNMRIIITLYLRNTNYY